jgi:hypothetical protein
MAVVKLHSDIFRQLLTTDFIAPHGWTGQVRQAIEELRFGRILEYLRAASLEEEDDSIIRRCSETSIPYLRILSRVQDNDGQSRVQFIDCDPRLAISRMCQAIAALQGAVSAKPEAAGKTGIPVQWEVDRQIIETLRAVSHRCTTKALLAVMGKRGLNPSDSTVKKRLAEMVKDRRLTKNPRAKPPGYGLPEWGDGSAGS